MDNFNIFEKGLNRYLSAEVILRLQKVKIGVAGAGGLGSNCAQMLVRSGFRRLKIVDHDVLESSNLNRQFYFLHQVGRAKVDALLENLKLINPDVEIETAQVKIEKHNVRELFADCDAVVEAFDSPEYKKLIIEHYLASDKLLTAASGLAGWGDSDEIKIHKVKENFYLIGDLISGVGPDCPPLAPKVIIAAAKQADVILDYFLAQLTKDRING